MKVNEIFYSLQGEGFNAGTPAVFVRFAGCNLQCPFCDTDFAVGTEMTEEDIAAQVVRYPASLVVITGGEPSLQLTESLVDALHRQGRRVAVETNGTHPLPSNVDWITLSPKDTFLGMVASPILTEVDELKVVFDGIHQPVIYENIKVRHARFLQPCDTGDPQRNGIIVNQVVEYVKANPQWRLSLQIHKMIGIR
ncbi:MAG: 7-carboxy-7-deazaguanine synthase QueE [Bacteroidales bacterium]|nr:7-carboxy-7-deazaguanine synthase QueE [Bacteroidales bacterium]